MRSFLLTRRLYFLSRTLIRHKFSTSEVSHTKDDISPACLSLYSDMLQYSEEHPDYGYREIYCHFVDDDTRKMLDLRHRQKILLAIAIVCIAIIVIGYFILNRLTAYLLENVPISYIKV